MTDWLKEAEKCASKIQEIRRTIHQNPELGNREFATAKLVAETLAELGIEVERMLDTAVVGTLKGAKPGKTVAIRADMDALPVTETSGCSFASKVQGKMHACGHDVHTAGLLGAAMVLAANKDKLAGTVKFLFQPDEEGDGGALRMIEQGAMKGVDAAFGCHVFPNMPMGCVGIKYGKFYAANDEFVVEFTGKGCHAATPEEGNDALAAACEAVGSLLKIRDGFPGEHCVVSVGTIQAGVRNNVIADHAQISGIIRTLGPDMRTGAKEMFCQAVKAAEEHWGVKAEIKMVESYSGVVNRDPETELCKKVAEELLGKDHVQIIAEPVMTTEDAGYFIDEADAGCFYNIGAGSEYPLHNPNFLPAEELLPILSAYHAAVAEAYLSS